MKLDKEMLKQIAMGLIRFQDGHCSSITEMEIIGKAITLIEKEIFKNKKETLK